MKTLIRLILIGAVVLLGMHVLGHATPAPAAQLQGLVVDQTNNAPIAHATIVVYPNHDTVYSDAAGIFNLVLTPGQSRLIKISHPSFETRTFADIVVTAAAAKMATFELFARSAGANEESSVGSQEVDHDGQAASAAKNRATTGPTKERLESERRTKDERKSNRQPIPPAAQVLPQGDITQSLDATSSSNLYGGGHLQKRDKRAYPATPKPMPRYPEADFYSRPHPYDMFFQDYGTNRFVPTRYDNQSTFAADVDDASYTLVRQYLRDGNLPPTDALRIEEFVNHFDYDYTTPEYQKFGVQTSLTDSPFDDSTMLFVVGIKGREMEKRERKPLNLTFVIDVSGSMGYDNRMQVVKYALHELTSQLNRHDRIAIVSYGSGAAVRLPSTNGNAHHLIDQVINALRPGGSTNAEAGLRLGYHLANKQYVAGHVNRIVICSDGVANVGLTNAEALKETIIDCAGRGITLSSVGVGMGNYNDVLLEKLAKFGDGRYAYVNDRREAHKVMVEDFLGNMDILARDTKIQVEFNPEIVQSYRLLGYENRDVADNKFRDNREDGGEIGPGHEVTAIYELVFDRRRPRGEFATINVRWMDESGSEVAELNKKATVTRHTRFYTITPDLRLAVSAAKLAEKVKDTYYVRDLSYAELYEFASPLAQEAPSEQTFELLELIDRAGGLNTYHSRK